MLCSQIRSKATESDLHYRVDIRQRNEVVLSDSFHTQCSSSCGYGLSPGDSKMGSLLADRSPLSPLRSSLLSIDSWTFAVSHPVLLCSFRCHNVLFVRGDGLVKLGGYSWLTRADECANYYFPMRARQDGRNKGWNEPWECVGYYPKEVLFDEEWTPKIDVYALGMVIIHFVTQRKP